MEKINSGKEKQLAYINEYKKYDKAMKEEFYLEAIVIGYAIIEDRLLAFLHHAGIVSRQNDNIKINKKVSPYVRRLLGIDGDYRLNIRNISFKIELITRLLEMDEQEAVEIDESVKTYIQGCQRKPSIASPGYMHALYIELKKVIPISVKETFDLIEPWRNERNQLIHALLNKTVASANETKKNCAEECYKITRNLDNYLVKPFKKNNRLRQKYKIQ